MIQPSLGKDLLGLEHLSCQQIKLILDTAEPFKEVSERAIKKVPTLRGKTIVNLFFETSTRTRVSFEFAEKRLSADTVNVAASDSSVQKGENLVDTARNLEAMRIDMVVMRHPSSGTAQFLAERIRSNVVNAGDGQHEHPTQGLLDILTIRDKLERIEGVNVCVCGDILHSRVARSNIWGLLKLGANVSVCGPQSLMPRGIEELGVNVFRRIEEAIEWADALNILRLQLERMECGYIPSLREYYRVFGVTIERLEHAKKELLILHPGPMNRGVEIDSRVADGPHSRSQLSRPGDEHHPTQGLLDILTIRDKLERIEGVNVCVCGDILHSRVARSNIWGLLKLGANVSVCGPQSLMPRGIEELGVNVFRRIEEAIEWADALNILRLQLERMECGYIPSLREYYRVFGVTIERLEHAKKELLILHPGPMNRGVEIDSRVADGPHSLILDQVTNGVAVRMAVLYLLAGGDPELAEAAKGKTGGAE